MLRLGKATRSLTSVISLSRNNFAKHSRLISQFHQKIDVYGNQQKFNFNAVNRLSVSSMKIDQCRLYSSKKNEEEDVIEVEAEIPENPADYLHTHLPATVAIPEVWPYLPCIAVSRNPVFPRFMKILEVSCLDREKLQLMKIGNSSFQIQFFWTWSEEKFA